jgi:alpha-beta hydrolase superfamily lysophospholipase
MSHSLPFGRRFWIWAGALAVAALSWAALLFLAEPKGPLFTNTAVISRGQHRELVVMVHAFEMTTDRLRDVREATEAALPDADLLVPEYPANLLSNASPILLADRLSATVQEAFDAKPNGYDRVILVGHSIGALMVRKAYVVARGETQELAIEGLQPRPRPWARKVSRIVLLAGMNRGWEVTPRPRDMSVLQALYMRIGARASQFAGIGGLIRSLRRGSPFVVNLSLQWLNLSALPQPMPEVVQLLGTRDDIVSAADNVDFYAGSRFFYRTVPDTGHRDMIEFAGDAGHSVGSRRRQRFVDALTASREVLAQENEFDARLSPDPKVDQVVFVMHGIRDFGSWTENVARVLQDEAAKNGVNIRVITSGYGYFPMGAFLLFSERQKNVRWFMDQYTRAKALYPNARFQFLGHSNGTYLLASALREYRACSVDRAVFAGTVMRRDYPWDDLIRNGQIAAIRNYVATGDWVVGWFPHMFEELEIGDVGGAGLFGFTNDTARRDEVRFVEGEHDAALAAANLPGIAQFLVSGTRAVVPAELYREQPVGWVVFLGNLCWLVWLFLLGLAGGLFGIFVFVWPRIGPRWVRAVVYLGAIVALLNTY